MITVILVILILVAGLMGAYTLKFQQAALNLGKHLAPENPFLPTGFQDAITPKIQTVRSVIWPILILAVFVYGTIFYKWYWGLVFAASTFLIVIPILKLVFPKVGSDFYKQQIKRGLLNRLAQYEKAGDENRQAAMSEILARFDRLDKE